MAAAGATPAWASIRRRARRRSPPSPASDSGAARRAAPPRPRRTAVRAARRRTRRTGPHRRGELHAIEAGHGLGERVRPHGQAEMRRARQGTEGHEARAVLDWPGRLPRGMARPPMAMVTARARNGCANSSWIHGRLATFGPRAAPRSSPCPRRRGRPSDCSAAGGHFGPQVRHPRLPIRDAIRDDHAVAVVASGLAAGPGAGGGASPNMGRKGRSWKLARSPRGARPARREPPWALTRVSLHTSFFMACSGFTQGPPVWLQPPERVHRHLQAQPVALRGRVPQHLLPLGGVVDDALLHELRRVNWPSGCCRCWRRTSARRRCPRASSTPGPR